MLYRYQKITDDYTTHTARLPDGAIDHGEMPDGCTYVAFVDDVPEQVAEITLELVTETPEVEAVLREHSPQFLLLAERVAAGLYVDSSNHVVAGNSGQVEAWRDGVEVEFFWGGVGCENPISG